MMMSVGGACCCSTAINPDKSLFSSHRLTFRPQSLACNLPRPPLPQLRLCNSMLSALSDDAFGGTAGHGSGTGGSGGDDYDGWNSDDDDGEGPWSFLSWNCLFIIILYWKELPVHEAYSLFQFSNFVQKFVRSIVKNLEPMNTLASSVWREFGFHWIVVGGQALLEVEDSPCLYSLTLAFLDVDVFLIIFCIWMACIVLFIVLFALVCIISIIEVAYALKDREDDIRSLPKYRFSQSNVLVLVDDNNSGSHISEISLHPDDSECCICLCPYVDGTELYCLPCTHHFHSGCISHWLRIKATCPLCQFNIRRGDTLV